MHFTGATLPGSPDVPNEDWSASTSDLIVVLDGATVRTETGCTHGAAWYTRKLGAAIIGNAASRSTPLDQVLADAIRDVAALHPGCALDHPGTPSAGVAIVRLDGPALRYLVLGDVTVALDTIDGVAVVSDQRISTSAAAERAEVDRHPIGSETKAAALVTMKHAELAARGQEYWVAAADPSAVQHAITGSAPLGDVHRLAVMTDGAARWVDLFRAGGWGAALGALARTGPEWFIQRLVRPIEQADPLGVRYPRNKVSDDATVVFAELAKPPAREFEVSPEEQATVNAVLLHRFNDTRLYGDGMLLRR